MRTATHARRIPVDEIIEDVEWLAGTDSPDSIARRIGMPSVEALETALRRAKRTDLWAKLQKAAPATIRTHEKAA